MAVTLDQYETEFVEALVQNPRLEDAYVRGLAREIIQLFDRITENVDADEDVFGGDVIFQVSMIDQAQRSIFYEQEISRFAEEVVQDPPDDLQVWAEASYATVPWFAQELEGTVKRGLQTVAYLLRMGAKPTIPPPQFTETKCKFLQNAIDQVRRSAEEGSHLSRLVDELDPPPEQAGAEGAGVKINHLRRAVAHSDFIFRPGDTPSILFFDDDVHKFPVIGFLEVFLRFEGLVRTLNTALHLGLRRLTGQPDTDQHPRDLYGGTG